MTVATVGVAITLGVVAACVGFFVTCVGTVLWMANAKPALTADGAAQLVLLASSVTAIAAFGFTIWGVLKFCKTSAPGEGHVRR